MNVGLIDVDSHNYPNFALMRLSAWHKTHGDNVEWADPMFGQRYDRVYKSKIFTFSPDNNFPWECDVIKGGSIRMSEFNRPLIFTQRENPDLVALAMPLKLIGE